MVQNSAIFTMAD